MVNPVGANSLISADIRKGAEKFAELSDSELLYLAHNKTVSDQKEKRSKLFNNAVIKTVPIIDSAIFASQKKEMLGLTAGSTLAPALGAFATRLASWGFFLGVFDLSSKIFNKLTDKSDKLTDLKNDHPIVHTGMDFGLGYAAYIGARNAGFKAVNSIPQATKAKALSKLAQVKETINTSKIAKNVFEPMVKRAVDFTKKYPKLAEKLPQLKKFTVPAVLVGMMVKLAIIDPAATNRKVAKNFVELKTDQDAVKMLLDADNSEI